MPDNENVTQRNFPAIQYTVLTQKLAAKFLLQFGTNAKHSLGMLSFVLCILTVEVAAVHIVRRCRC